MKTALYLLASLLLIICAFVVLLVISALCVDKDKVYEKDSTFYRFLMNAVVSCVILCCRIRIHVSGREKIPQSSRFVLVGNHVSNFDPIVQLYVLRDFRLAFVSKEENLRIPIVGRIIRRCCTLAIDRKDARKAMTAITKAIELITADEVSIGIYPEGTRSKTGELLPFHNGVFKIAQKADVPIVVAAIHGSAQVSKRAPWRRTDVYLNFVEVIPASNLKGKRTDVIGERVRNSILKSENRS